MDTPTAPALLLTVEEAARRLGLGRTTVYGLIRDGELHSVRIGRARRIPAEALTDLVQRRTGRHAHAA